MRFVSFYILTLSALSVAFSAHADIPRLAVQVADVRAGAPIPASQALCVPTPNGKSEKVAAPVRPSISWSGVPSSTASIAVFMMDPDVPADFSNAGKEGVSLPEDSARQDFYHFAVVDLPPSVREITGGIAAKKLNMGKALPNDLGLNGYVTPISSYGGPCPPWNDERVHNYHFIVMALAKNAPLHAPQDTAKKAYERLISSPELLAIGAVVGTYTLNPALGAQ